MISKKDSHPDKNLAAICSLFRPGSTLFICTATNEPQRLSYGPEQGHEIIR